MIVHRLTCSTRGRPSSCSQSRPRPVGYPSKYAYANDCYEHCFRSDKMMLSKAFDQVEMRGGAGHRIVFQSLCLKVISVFLRSHNIDTTIVGSPRLIFVIIVTFNLSWAIWLIYTQICKDGGSIERCVQSKGFSAYRSPTPQY